jgi:hypothetical protein
VTWRHLLARLPPRCPQLARPRRPRAPRRGAQPPGKRTSRSPASPRRCRRSPLRNCWLMWTWTSSARQGPGEVHRGRLSIDADQGHGRKEDPRRHAGRLPSWSALRRAHHAGRSIDADQGHGRGMILDADQVTRPRDDPRRHAAGCRSTGTRAKAAGSFGTSPWSRPSTRSPRGPAVDRRGPGPRPRGRSSTRSR